MSPISKCAPKDESLYKIAFIEIRSMIPVNISPEPIGNTIGKGLAPRRSLIISSTL